MIGPLNGCPKTSLNWSFPIRYEILNVSQIGIAFHRICTPISFRLDCNNTAEVLSFTALSAIPCVSDLCGVLTYNDSRKDLHKLCQIPRTCQCKWLSVSYLAPRTFASSFVFPEKFLFCTDALGSIEWPSPAPWLHIDDCFEIHNLHWEPCDLLSSSHQKFLHEVPLRHCVFCTVPILGPLADLAISVFKEEMSINTVLTQIVTSLGCGLFWYFMRRTGVRVPVFRNSVIHQIFSEFLQPLRDFSKQRVSPFYHLFNIWAWHRHWMESIPLRFSFSRVSLSLDSVVVGEVDELEEDVGGLLSCLEGVIELMKASLRKNSLISQEPRSERSFPCCRVSESRF